MDPFCFISYKHHEHDNKFLEALKKRLEDAHIQYWYDHHIQSGRQWEAYIDDKLVDAGVIIIIVSSNSVKSQYVTYEWAFARGYCRDKGPGDQKLIIPLILDRPLFDSGGIHPGLLKHQVQFFTENPDSWPWDKLIEDIQDFFEKMEPSIPEELRYTIDGLNTGEPSRIDKSIDTLERSTNKYAPIALRKALNHSDPHVPPKAALALSRKSKNTDTAVIPQLKAIIGSDNTDLGERKQTLRSLGDLGANGASECGEIVLNALNQPYYDIKIEAIRALGKMKYQPARDKLVKLLDYFEINQNNMLNLDYAREAADALGLIGDDAVVPALQMVLGVVYAMGREQFIRAVLGALSRMGRSGLHAILEVTFGYGGLNPNRLIFIIDALCNAMKVEATSKDLDAEYEDQWDISRKDLVNTIRKKFREDSRVINRVTHSSN